MCFLRRMYRRKRGRDGEMMSKSTMALFVVLACRNERKTDHFVHIYIRMDLFVGRVFWRLSL